MTSDVKGYFSSIGTSFIGTKQLFESGFTYNPPAVGACINPNTVVYGHTISLAICEPLQKFSPIFYLVFTLVFTYLAIRIFIFGFTL